MKILRVMRPWPPLLLILAQVLHAHCGLNFCPRVEETPENAFEVGLGLHQTGFDLNGHGGQYSEIQPQIQYTHQGRWLLGANLGFAGLNVEGETNWGMENPLLMGEWRFFPGMGNRIAMGVQVELPLGDEDHGIGTDHTMLVPYLSFGKGFDPLFASATVGYSQALGGEEHEEENLPAEHHSFNYVHPHEDQEFLYRVSVGISLWDNKARPEVFLSGQHVLSEENENLPSDESDDLTVGIQFPHDIHQRLTLVPRLEFPVLSPSRFDWSAGLDIRMRL